MRNSPFPSKLRKGDGSKLSVQSVTCRKWPAVSQIMSGMVFFCWASSWMCSLITQGPAARALLRDLRPPVFFFPTQGVLKEGDTRRLAQAWLSPPLCPCVRSICSVLLLLSSTSSVAQSTNNVAFLFAYSLPSGWDPRSGLPSVPLSLSSFLMCMKEVSPGRRLT